MELELDYSDLAKAGKLWVRCKTLAKGDDSAVKSGFVEIFGISHIGYHEIRGRAEQNYCATRECVCAGEGLKET